MPTYEQHHARQETDELDRFVGIVMRKVTEAAKVQAGGRGDCFPVMVSTAKDADLEESGCVGLEVIRATAASVTVRFGQHWAQEWCDTCEEAHRLHDFTEGCRGDSGSDCDHAEETVERTFALSEFIQKDPYQIWDSYRILAKVIVRSCKNWAWGELNHPAVGAVVRYSFQPYDSGTGRIISVERDLRGYTVELKVLEGTVRNRLFHAVSHQPTDGKTLTAYGISDKQLEAAVDGDHQLVYVYPV